MLKKLFNFLLDCLFPWECLKCGKEGEPICSVCLKLMPLSESDLLFDHPLIYLDGVFWACLYSEKTVQQAVHLLKYDFLKKFSEPLSEIMIAFFLKNKIIEKFPCKTLIIPIPLHKKRFLERGFNQSELIAEKFSARFHYAYLKDCLARKINTPHQVGLKQKERQKNIKGAFCVKKPEKISGKIIILIDDVITTGSTLEEAARTLKNNGAVNVFGLVIAKD